MKFVEDLEQDASLLDVVLIAPLLPAFEAVCRSLQITSNEDPLAELAALKVIQLAKTGERDLKRLHDLVMLALNDAVSARRN
jgi:hypothetical protein